MVTTHPIPTIPSDAYRDDKTDRQGKLADENVSGVRPAVCLAEEVGARLGAGEVLFGPLPPGEAGAAGVTV